MKELTPRQKEVLEALKAFIADKGYPPSVSDVSRILGIGRKAAYDHLNTLEKKKKITWSPSYGTRRAARGIKILPDLFLAKQDIPKAGIQQGDYVHCLNGELVAITRFSNFSVEQEDVIR